MFCAALLVFGAALLLCCRFQEDLWIYDCLEKLALILIIKIIMWK